MAVITPKVSILVPIYNVDKYLEQCLDSIVDQTLSEIEIVCINDGSTDDSLKILKRYAKRDDRIVIINKKNSGYGDSMNRGLAKARGEFIGIVESDDWIELDAFEKLYNLAVENNADVVKSNYYNYFTDPVKSARNGTVTKLVHPDEVGRVINPEEHHHIFYQQPAIWTAIYNRDFLQSHDITFLPSPGASYQDTGFSFKVWASTKRAFFTESAYLHYRQDNENSSVNSPGKVFCVADEYAEIESYLVKHDRMKVYGELMRSTRWGAYAWNIDRLTPKLAEEFIELASKQYHKDKNDGSFNFEYFDVNQSRAVSELIDNPAMVVRRKHALSSAEVSVIVPVYNVEKYLRQCLDSVINQTMENIEIIVVDDGSRDGSSDILEEYYRREPRMQLVNQHNSGQAAARNRGLERVHSDYVMFLDSDDYYELDSIEKLHKAISTHDTDIAIGSIRVVYQDKRFTAIEKNNDKQYYAVKFKGNQPVTESLMQKTDVSPCNKIFKKSLIWDRNIRFPEGLKYEDAYFFYAYAWSSTSAYFLPSNMYVYNYLRRPGSTMAQTFDGSSFAHDHLQIAIELFDFLKKSDSLKERSEQFVLMFKDFVSFSLRYLPAKSHGEIHKSIRAFLAAHGDYLDTIDPSIRVRLSTLLPHYSYTKIITRKVKNAPRRIARIVLPKVSISYRSRRYILTAIEDLQREIELRTEAQDNKTNRLLDEIDTLRSLLNKK